MVIVLSPEVQRRTDPEGEICKQHSLAAEAGFFPVKPCPGDIPPASVSELTL